jgi:hypothetical protein
VDGADVEKLVIVHPDKVFKLTPHPAQTAQFNYRDFSLERR